MILQVEQLGLVDYAEAIELQRVKVAQRKLDEIPDTLLLLDTRLSTRWAATPGTRICWCRWSGWPRAAPKFLKLTAAAM